jgi:hypothetical protein
MPPSQIDEIIPWTIPWSWVVHEENIHGVTCCEWWIWKPFHSSDPCRRRAKSSRAILSRSMNKFMQYEYFYLGIHIILIISYLNDTRQYNLSEQLLDDYHRHDIKNWSFRQMEKSEQRFIIKFFFSKALTPMQIMKNWPLYSDLQYTLLVKSMNDVPASRQVICLTRTNPDVLIFLKFWERLSLIFLMNFFSP